jgi:lysophospholipase L1-like esterase
MATDAELDAAVRRVLGEILTEGEPYTSLPMMRPDTGLLAPAVMAALDERYPDPADVSALADSVGEQAVTLGAVGDTVVSQGESITELEDLTENGRLSETELKHTIDAEVTPAVSAARRAGAGIVALGDSNTVNYGGTVFSAPDSYLMYALVASGARVPFRGIFATGGYTVQQIRDTHLPQVLALSPRPAAAVVMALTNNLTSPNFVADTAAYLEIIDGLVEVGIEPIIQTIPPRGDSSSANTEADKLNRWLRSVAAARGHRLSDLHKAVTDPATTLATFRTGYGQTDGIHLSFLGTKKAGVNALAPVLTAMFPSSAPPVAMSKSQAGNLLGALGMLYTDARNSGNETAGDGIADGFRNFGASVAVNTYTIGTDADGYGYQRIVIPATTGGNVNLQTNNIATLTGAVAVGDVVEFSCRVKAEGFEANLAAPITTNGGVGPAWSILVEYQDTGSGWNNLLRLPYVAHCDVDGYIWGQRPIPASANGNLRLSLTATGATSQPNPMTLEFGQLNYANLTALGI